MQSKLFRQFGLAYALGTQQRQIRGQRSGCHRGRRGSTTAATASVRLAHHHGDFVGPGQQPLEGGDREIGCAEECDA
jgi:hypothetical protein